MTHTPSAADLNAVYAAAVAHERKCLGCCGCGVCLAVRQARRPVTPAAMPRIEGLPVATDDFFDGLEEDP